MKQTRIRMGMPVTVEILDARTGPEVLDGVFSYFQYVDEKFSTYKDTSEITRINRGQIRPDDYSPDMVQVLALSEETKRKTGGYFDIVTPSGSLDPSGLVKGWAIRNAANTLAENGFEDFYVEAGGDIQFHGKNADGGAWRVGIRNPFNLRQIVKSLQVRDLGVATSGSYVRGSHVYNPLEPGTPLDQIVSLTVIGPDVFDADRFATAAFAMSGQGIHFIEQLDGFEGYAIDRQGVATLTSGFGKYVAGAD